MPPRITGTELAGHALVNTLDPNIPLSSIMSRPRVARGDSTVDSLVDLMTRYHVGAIPIVDSDDRPIGIVTKLDLVECRDEERKTAREVMMPHAMSLRPQDTLVRAASLMSREGFHHVLVVTDDGKLEGIVSTFDVTRWVANLAALDQTPCILRDVQS